MEIFSVTVASFCYDEGCAWHLLGSPLLHAAGGPRNWMKSSFWQLVFCSLSLRADGSRQQIENCIHNCPQMRDSTSGKRHPLDVRGHRSKSGYPETGIRDFPSCFEGCSDSWLCLSTSPLEDFSGRPLTHYSSPAILSPAVLSSAYPLACFHGECDSPLLPLIRVLPFWEGGSGFTVAQPSHIGFWPMVVIATPGGHCQ